MHNLFTELTETEAVTLYTLFDSGLHHTNHLPLRTWTPAHQEVATELAQLQGQLAVDMAYADGKPNTSRVLLDEVFGTPKGASSDQL